MPPNLPLSTNESTDLVLVEPPPLSVRGVPDEVLREAQRAASALKRVIDAKPNPVRMGGKTYLEFEDWQTVGKFYGVTARTLATRPVIVTEEIDDRRVVIARGWEAEAAAELFTSSGQITISRAESMCLTDEPKWAGKPAFQLRSMAQTRACSKVLRNVLAWVVVLAGYGATPAEELPSGGKLGPISDAQRKRLFKLSEKHGWTEKSLRDLVREAIGISDTTQIAKDQYDDLCKAIEKGPDHLIPPIPASSDEEAF